MRAGAIKVRRYFVNGAESDMSCACVKNGGDRFYYESDGHYGSKTHYVVDRYADPLGDSRRRDVASRQEGRKLAALLNKYPDVPPWDTIQVERDRKEEHAAKEFPST